MPDEISVEANATGAGSPTTPDADQASRPKGRRYGFACIPCKQRKVKCSGEQPICAGCQRKGSECVWPPSSRSVESQLLREANERIRQLEDTLVSQPSALNTAHGVIRNPDQHCLVPGTADREAVVSPSEHARNRQRMKESRARPDHETHNAKRARRESRRLSFGVSEIPSQSANELSGSPQSVCNRRSSLDPSSESQKSRDPRFTPSLWYQVGIGEDGEVVYNGPTSRFHAGTLPNQDDHEEAEDGSDASSNDDAENVGNASVEDERGLPAAQEPDSRDGAADLPRSRDDPGTPGTLSRMEPPPGHLATLQSHYTLMDSVWTPLIAAKPTMNGTGVDTKTGVALLDIYWTWLHPLHHLVYRPAFVMDLALGGPHCSDFLLLCIFALAARHLPSEASGLELGSARGEEYATRARALLLDEMTAASPSIPTIQGLLILGGRQCAIGSSSQGWLYTGMAIRMMQDVGLHLDTTGLAGVSEKWTPTELEVRKRLYNAAYVWDKTLSLALGRPPTLTRRPYPAFELFDKYDDRRLWQPVHAKEVVDSFEPSPSWVTSTLCVFSSLHEITTDMLLLFSRVQGTRQFNDQVSSLDLRFRRWYAEIPDGMKINKPSVLTQSPPPHIVSLNLLYHTLHILLRRPFLGGDKKALGSFSKAHAEHCISHSKSIHEIHTLYTKTFPHRLMTYQVSYCIYTAATVEALELKTASLSPEERSGAAARLTAAVRILQNEANHTPGSGKSLDTIRRLLTEGERATVRRPRHTSRRKRRSTNRSLMQGAEESRNSQAPDQQVRSTEKGVAIEYVTRSSLQQSVHDTDLPGPGPATSNTEGSSEFSIQAQGCSGNGNPTLAGSNLIGHPLGLCPSINSHGPLGQDFGNGSFDIDAGIWGLDSGFYGGVDTGAGFHPDAFSFVYTADSDLPRIPAPTAPAAAHSVYLYSPNPGWSSRNQWPASGP